MNINSLFLCPALLLSLAHAAHADEPAPATPPAASVPATYRIANEDVLGIRVLNQPDLTMQVTVLPDGKISYPFLDDIKVTGLTTDELSRRITKALAAKFVRPQVTVNVISRQMDQVSVIGTAVRTPGNRNLKEGWRVMDALADAGGLSVEKPGWATALLLRKGGTQPIPIDLVRLMNNADPNENQELKAGDMLLIQALDPSRIQIAVLGEVGKSGLMAVPEDGSVLTVLSSAGGPSPRAALSRASILRAGKSIPLNLQGITEGKVPETIKMEPGDTLMIPSNKLQFSVVGAVNIPGAKDFPEGEPVTVMSAIARAGGTARDANIKEVTLIRGAEDGTTTRIVINLEEVHKKGDLSKDIPVQPNDYIFVQSKDPKKKFGIWEALQFIPFIGYLR